LRQLGNCSAILWGFVLGQHAKYNFNNASSLKQQSVERHVALLGHINLNPSQPVLNAACLAEKH